MASLRQHGTTLIAGLVFLGVLAVIGASARTHVDPGPLTAGVIWFGGAFVAAHLARRYLPELDTGSLCIAALVMATVALGIVHKRTHETIDVAILVELGLTFAGTLAGVFTARRAASGHASIKVLGAGAVGFGAATLGVGLALLSDNEPVVEAFLVAAPLGALLATWLTEADTLHAALGQTIYFVLISFITVYPRHIAGILFMAFVTAVIGWLLGAIGGAIGYRLRGARRAAQQPDLPKARQID